MEYQIYQGDQCVIPFTVYVGGFLVTDKDAEDVEIVLGPFRKTFKNGDLSYNQFRMTFDFPLSQEETFKLTKGQLLLSQIRTKLKVDGSIFTTQGPCVRIFESYSKERI